MNLSLHLPTLVLALAWTWATPTLRAALSVHTDFPGGSGAVLNLDESSQTLVLDPTDHPERGWRCWWYVRLEGIDTTRPLTLEVGLAPWATPDQASWSMDGRHWQQTPPGKREGRRIRYTWNLPQSTAWIAWGPPFVLQDAQDLLNQMKMALPDLVTVDNLATTREGHPTPMLRIRAREGLPCLWIQARQHAWESGASWVARGLGEWLISSDPAAIDLRTRAEIVFVPIMDVDNAQRGAGGKNQVPQDHNRDWSDAPHWHAVAAAQKELSRIASEGRLQAFIDLHNPAAGDRRPFFFVPPGEVLNPEAQRQLQRFLLLAREHISGPLALAEAPRVSGAAYDPKAWKQISKNWVAALGTDAVSVTLETSWNNPASTTDGYRTVGRQLGQTLQAWLLPSP